MKSFDGVDKFTISELVTPTTSVRVAILLQVILEKQKIIQGVFKFTLLYEWELKAIFCYFLLYKTAEEH